MQPQTSHDKKITPSFVLEETKNQFLKFQKLNIFDVCHRCVRIFGRKKVRNFEQKTGCGENDRTTRKENKVEWKKNRSQSNFTCWHTSTCPRLTNAPPSLSLSLSRSLSLSHTNTRTHTLSPSPSLSPPTLHARTRHTRTSLNWPYLYYTLATQHPLTLPFFQHTHTYCWFLWKGNMSVTILWDATALEPRAAAVTIPASATAPPPPGLRTHRSTVRFESDEKWKK